MVGGVLTWGLERYDTYLDVQIKTLEKEKLQYEIEQNRGERMRDKMSDAGRAEIKFHVECFYMVVASPNIKRGEVNGIVVKDSQADDPVPQPAPPLDPGEQEEADF